MQDLLTFLNARLDEDERVALGARGRTWTPEDLAGGITEFHSGTFEHIARHDPARVLREVEAKRRIIGLCVGTLEDEDYGLVLAQEVLQRLALPYAEHPDYREEWRP